MGANQHNSGQFPEFTRLDAAWLDLLHLEQDGQLTPEQAEQLRTHPDQGAVQVQRQALQGVAARLHSLERPALPDSVAAAVVEDIGWRARLSAHAPPLPRSVAALVVTELRAAQTLQAAPPPTMPRSVAADVAGQVGVARQLQFTQPVLPQSVAASVAAEIKLAASLGSATPAPPHSVAGTVVGRLTAPGSAASAPPPAVMPSPQAVHALVASTLPRTNPAPLILVSLLIAGLTLLAVTTTWPNLAAGALVLRTLLAQVSPLAGLGLTLLLLTSALIAWKPNPAMRQLGAGAFALSAALTLPALYGVTQGGDIRFGHDITVSGPVRGNVIAIGGNIHLHSTARVQGEVVTLLGDVHRDDGARVSGRVNALLGRAPGDLSAVETTGLSMASAAAFRPVLGWLGSAAWPQIFLTLTGGALLLLFVAGLAPVLARRQRHAPMRTLSLGVLALAALVGPAAGLTLAGLLGPALMAAALATLLVAIGLSVSAYDVGRSFAYGARLPVPDAVGAMLGLTAVAASLSFPPLAFALAVIGGTWGAGTILLTRSPSRVFQPSDSDSLEASAAMLPGESR